MTNIAQLPLLIFPSNVTTNADWRDSWTFTNASAQFVATASVASPGTGYTNGTQTLTVIGGAGTAAQVTVFVANNQVIAVTGIPTPGSYSVLPAAISVPVSGGGGSGATLNLTFAASPIDLTGISFHSIVRTKPGDLNVVLDASTSNGLMVSGNTSGVLSYAIPLATLQTKPLWKAGVFYTDVTAFDAGAVNTALVAQITINVGQGITQ